MESFSFPFLPASYSAVHVALFTEIKNAVPLRRRIIDAATMNGEEGDREREAVNFAFINARLVGQPLVCLFESYSDADNQSPAPSDCHIPGHPCSGSEFSPNEDSSF
jgi:hypothetical protein